MLATGYLLLVNGDDRHRQNSILTMRTVELRKLFKLPQSISAKNTIAKAIRSPFLAMNGFALAYA